MTDPERDHPLHVAFDENDPFRARISGDDSGQLQLSVQGLRGSVIDRSDSSQTAGGVLTSEFFGFVGGLVVIVRVWRPRGRSSRVGLSRGVRSNELPAG